METATVTNNTETPVESAISTTKEEFKDFVKLVDQPTYNKYEEEVSRIEWNDELGRFCLWAGKVGFGKSGLDAVDARVSRSDSSIFSSVPIGEEILYYLQELRDLVRGARERVARTSSGDAGGETPSSGIQDSEKRVPDFNAGDPDESDSSEDSLILNTQTNLQYLVHFIHVCIDNLSGLSCDIWENLDLQD